MHSLQGVRHFSPTKQDFYWLHHFYKHNNLTVVPNTLHKTFASNNRTTVNSVSFLPSTDWLRAHMSHLHFVKVKQKKTNTASWMRSDIPHSTRFFYLYPCLSSKFCQAHEICTALYTMWFNFRKILHAFFNRRQTLLLVLMKQFLMEMTTRTALR